MASLINCQEVEVYSAEEFPGDTPYGAELLEIQTPPSGYLSTNLGGATGNPGIKYLVIKPLPGYKIDRSMITISTSSGLLSPLISGDTIMGQNTTYPNGKDEYWFPPDELSDMIIVLAYDSLGTDWSNCDNNVIIQFFVHPAFEMPNSDYIVSVDLGGTAVECFVTPPGPDPVPDDPNPEPPNIAAFKMTTDFICTTASDSFPGQLFRAFHFNDWDAQYALTNQSSLWIYDTNTQEPIVQDAICNPCGCLPDEWYEADPCVGQLQPTCFSRARTVYSQNQSLLDPPAEGTNVFPSVESMFLFSDGSVGPVTFWADAAVPDQNTSELSSIVGGGTSEWLLCGKKIIRKIWDNTINDPSDYNFSYTDYPTISPSSETGAPLPLSETIIIKVPTNQSLPATSDFVDVWGALTIVHREGGESMSSMGDITSVSIASSADTVDLSTKTYYQYTAVDNQCHVDLSGIQLEQGEDDSTVKITIPYNTNISLTRTQNMTTVDAQGSWAEQYETRIFYNIYPIS
tara:strand:- start:4320 stop:5864 length:1545 start_codon:yes stop_codon:yes gene_type:complete